MGRAVVASIGLDADSGRHAKAESGGGRKVVAPVMAHLDPVPERGHRGSGLVDVDGVIRRQLVHNGEHRLRCHPATRLGSSGNGRSRRSRLHRDPTRRHGAGKPAQRRTGPNPDAEWLHS